MSRSNLPFLLFALYLFSCTKSQTVGKDVILDDLGALDLYIDTIEKVDHLLPDSVQVYDYANGTRLPLERQFVGKYEDPIFGKTYSEVYAQFRLTVLSPEIPSGASVDSVMLSLDYDPSGFYGDTTVSQTLEVYRITESIDADIDHYAKETFETSAEPIGSLTFIPDPGGVSVVNGDTLSSRVRIALDPLLGEEVLNLDSTALASNNNFLEIFKGLAIRPAGVYEPLMMSFVFQSGVTGIDIHYTADQEDHILRLGITNRSFISAHYEHDYSGTVIEDKLEGAGTDSQIYIQGLSGVEAAFTVDLSGLNPNDIIHAAYLNVYLAMPPDITAPFYPLGSLWATYYNMDGNLVLIPESIQQDNIPSLALFLGGDLYSVEKGGLTYYRYSMNVSEHLQRIREGETDPRIVIRPATKALVAARSILQGNTSGVTAPTLYVYTSSFN